MQLPHSQSFSGIYVPGSVSLYVSLYFSVFIVLYIPFILSDYLYYKNSHLLFTNDSIEVLESRFSKNKLVYPYAQISNIYVSQGFIERLLGLSTILISGEEDEDYEMKGFSFGQASKFASEIATKYKIKISV